MNVGEGVEEMWGGDFLFRMRNSSILLLLTFFIGSWCSEKHGSGLQIRMVTGQDSINRWSRVRDSMQDGHG